MFHLIKRDVILQKKQLLILFRLSYFYFHGCPSSIDVYSR